MKRINFISLLAALCLLCSTSLLAQQSLSKNDIPRTISYQGQLTNSDGAPLFDGSYHITISLCTNPDGSNPVWQQTYNTSLTRGIFNLYLGSTDNPLPDAAILNQPLWIATRIGDGPLMSPLTPLSASPYALNVSDKSITNGKLADGAVTAEKVDMDYISGVEINDQKVAGVGTVLKLKSSDDIALNYDETTNSITIASNKEAQSGTTTDPEKNGKGPSVLDATDMLENWKGRTNPAGALTFQAPVGTFNTLAGGSSNTIGSATNFSGIVGGESNLIDEEAEYAFIGGGLNNHITGSYSVIGGGENNAATLFYNTIGGGIQNTADGYSSTIGGGQNNNARTTAVVGFIGGGRNNVDSNSATVVTGGEYNSALGYASSIGGGAYNVATGDFTTIPGGDHLKTQSYATTTVGFYNAPRGIQLAQPTISARATIDDPLFMVGNGAPATLGGTTIRSNAFEVSTNGHTVVYDVNGSSSLASFGRSPFKGATYTDNIIYAWGSITGGGGVSADFGVESVSRVGMGLYLIRMALRDPVTNLPATINGSSVTATLRDLGETTPCAFISASEVGSNGAGSNAFFVRIRDANCNPIDAHFMFKVTGRP